MTGSVPTRLVPDYDAGALRSGERQSSYARCTRPREISVASVLPAKAACVHGAAGPRRISADFSVDEDEIFQ